MARPPLDMDELHRQHEVSRREARAAKAAFDEADVAGRASLARKDYEGFGRAIAAERQAIARFTAASRSMREDLAPVRRATTRSAKRPASRTRTGPTGRTH
jgi:hypothetical protein